MPQLSTARAALLTLALLASLAPRARADSDGGRPDEHSAIRHAESVVAGAFTGATQRRTIEQPNAIDAQGRAYTARLQVLAHEFAVTEHLDGPTTPTQISILVPGALALPAPRRRVVVGVRAEGARPEEGYNLLYGRALEADTDARLAELRGWVQTVRAPAPVDPQALAEAVGLYEAEQRGDEPVPGGPIGPDLPVAGPEVVGPPQGAPRVVELQGDPRHPPEPDGAEAAAPDPGEPAPPRGGGAGPRARGADRGDARAAAPASSGAPSPPPRRWPYVAGAMMLLAAGTLWRRQRRR